MHMCPINSNNGRGKTLKPQIDMSSVNNNNFLLSVRKAKTSDVSDFHLNKHQNLKSRGSVR